MFGSSLISAEDSKAVTSYYSALKRQLVKSKAQSNNAKKRIGKAVTLDKIRSDFPFISDSLRTDNPHYMALILSKLIETKAGRVFKLRLLKIKISLYNT
jgi:hypothetical protein